MSNLVIVLILVAILGAAARYVVKAKKNGRKCIGCPDGCCPSVEKCGKGASCACCCFSADTETDGI